MGTSSAKKCKTKKVSNLAAAGPAAQTVKTKSRRRRSRHVQTFEPRSDFKRVRWLTEDQQHIIFDPDKRRTLFSCKGASEGVTRCTLGTSTYWNTTDDERDDFSPSNLSVRLTIRSHSLEYSGILHCQLDKLRDDLQSSIERTVRLQHRFVAELNKHAVGCNRTKSIIKALGIIPFHSDCQRKVVDKGIFDILRSDEVAAKIAAEEVTKKKREQHDRNCFSCYACTNY